MTDNEGWIPHAGGEMPCDGELLLDVKLRGDDILTLRARQYTWGCLGYRSDITFWRPHKNAEGQAGQEVKPVAWIVQAGEGSPRYLVWKREPVGMAREDQCTFIPLYTYLTPSQEGAGQAVAEVYQVWRSKTHAVSWNAHAVDALPVGTKLYASPACSAPDDGALKEQAEAWQAVCVVLGEIEPDWASRAKRGVDAAVLAIKGFAGKAAPDEALIEEIEEAAFWKFTNENLTAKECVKWAIREHVRRSAESVRIGAPNAIVKCEDCGLPYSEFPLDVVLSDAQWSAMTGKHDGSGILCASCIVARGAKLPGITVAKLVFE